MYTEQPKIKLQMKFQTCVRTSLLEGLSHRKEEIRGEEIKAAPVASSGRGEKVMILVNSHIRKVDNILII